MNVEYWLHIFQAQQLLQVMEISLDFLCNMTNLEQIITKYWGFVLFVLGLCFHAIYMYFQNADHEKRLAVLENKTNEHSNMVNTINSRLDSMDSKLDILVDGYNTNSRKK